MRSQASARALGAGATGADHSVLFRRSDYLRELGQARTDHTFEAVFRRYLAPYCAPSMTSAVRHEAL